MARRHRFIVLAFAVFGIALALGLLWLWPRDRAHPTINRDNFARIQVGMPLQDVQAILGGEARSARSGQLTLDLPDDAPAEQFAAASRFFKECASKSALSKVWDCDNLVIHVVLNANGRVARAECLPVRLPMDLQSILRRWRHR